MNISDSTDKVKLLPVPMCTALSELLYDCIKKNNVLIFFISGCFMYNQIIGTINLQGNIQNYGNTI